MSESARPPTQLLPGDRVLVRVGPHMVGIGPPGAVMARGQVSAITEDLVLVALVGRPEYRVVPIEAASTQILKIRPPA